MKIRMDFVTNSSSSCFVVASIHTENAALLEAVKSISDRIGEFNVDDKTNTIEIRLEECRSEFECYSPADVVAVLLEYIGDYGDAKQYKALSKQTAELEESIQEFSIDFGQTGNSGEAQPIWEKYITAMSDGDDDKYEEMWDEALDSDQWVTKRSLITYKAGDQKAEVEVSFEGPLGSIDEVMEDADSATHDESNWFEVIRNGSDGPIEVFIPASTIALDECAFLACSSLEKVELEDGLEEISECVFSYCDKLKEIRIPSSVKKIGAGSFSLCKSLEKVELEDGLEEISEGAFSDCDKLKEIRIPGSVKKIGKKVFSSCKSLEKVEIEEGIGKISKSAFSDCDKLKEIHILLRKK